MSNTSKVDEARLGNRRGDSTDREQRSEQDRSVTENRELTDSQRLEAFRGSLYQSALPSLPEIPGHHVCWLTTTNPRDTIQARQRLGYELLKVEDFKGFELLTSEKSAPFPGVISVNEMVAAKIPLSLYKMYMTESHHVQPLQEEEKLRAVIDVIKGEAQAKGADIIEEEGMAQLGKAPRPMFQGT